MVSRQQDIRKLAVELINTGDRQQLGITVPHKCNIVDTMTNGAWVDAQVWVPFDGTEFDKTPPTYEVTFIMAFTVKGVKDPENPTPAQVRSAVNNRMSYLDDDELVLEAIAIQEAVEEQR